MARQFWMQPPPWRGLGFEILAAVPEGFAHPTQGYVGLHIVYRAL